MDTDTCATTPDHSIAKKCAAIDNLDLEPIVFKLVHPERESDAIILEAADTLIEEYRKFLKLCAMYPDESIVPSKRMDPVWHAHILDTEKYYTDCIAIFGEVLHHFPYFGLRGPEDAAELARQGRKTCELYELNFGHDTTAPQPREDASCSLCHWRACHRGEYGDQVRPRLERV